METLIVDRTDGVVTITMNRPERKNAVNGVMWNELLEVFSTLGNDPAERAAILTGAGGEFCAGADLSAGGRAVEKHQLDRMHDITQVAMALHQVAIPTIAKVDGVAVGAGLNMALGCDLIVASERARFSEIFARRGLTIDFGGSWLLPRLVGLHKAKELALFGDIIDAKEAARLGIVNHVLPTDELDAFVANWAERLASGPPLALKMTKQLLNDGLTSSLHQALSSEGVAQTVNFSTEDTAEAIAAFQEKREPSFRGR